MYRVRSRRGVYASAKKSPLPGAALLILSAVALRLLISSPPGAAIDSAISRAAQNEVLIYELLSSQLGATPALTAQEALTRYAIRTSPQLSSAALPAGSPAPAEAYTEAAALQTPPLLRIQTPQPSADDNGTPAVSGLTELPENTPEDTPEPEITPSPLPEPVIPVTAATLPEIDSALLSRLSIRNSTDYAPDMAEYLSTPPVLSTGAESPRVLIVHTHGTEAFAPGENDYAGSDGRRSTDETQNVLALGALICQRLNAAGIPAIHDKTLNDHPNYTGAYDRTREIIASYLEQYPDIGLVLDVHRDAITNSAGEGVKTYAEAGGAASAQVMLVVGTDAGGLSHPDWRENLKLGLWLTALMEQSAPGLTRPLDLRTERFNQDLTSGSLIVEFGSDSNTLEEALTAAGHFSDSLIRLLAP